MNGARTIYPQPPRLAWQLWLTSCHRRQLPLSLGQLIPVWQLSHADSLVLTDGFGLRSRRIERGSGAENRLSPKTACVRSRQVHRAVKSTLDKLRISGGGPTYLQLGRRVLYDVAGLEAWLTSKRRSSTFDNGHGKGAEFRHHRINK